MTPHALFTRNVHGVTLTIEVNPLTHAATGHSTTNGVTTETKYATVLRFDKGISPFWSYESGIGSGPIWNERGGSSYAATPGDKSYITLLRMAVAQLTGGGMGFMGAGKPRLGFHSKYKARKRAERAMMLALVS